MFQDIGAPSPAAASLPWHQVWAKALTPSEQSYQELISDPNATPTRAYTWVAVSSLIGGALSVLLSGLFQLLFGAAASGSSEELGVAVGSGASVLLIQLFCVVPVVVVFSVLGLMISAAIMQWIAGALGGTGTYAKLVYAFGAYVAPLTLISGLIGAIPIVNCLAFPLGIYGIVLNVTAIKAVNQFGWGKAVASSLIIVVGVLVFVACATIVLLALLGPAIGNVFSNVIEGI